MCFWMIWIECEISVDDVIIWLQMIDWMMILCGMLWYEWNVIWLRMMFLYDFTWVIGCCFCLLIGCQLSRNLIILAEFATHQTQCFSFVAVDIVYIRSKYGSKVGWLVFESFSLSSSFAYHIGFLYGLL